MLAIAVFMDVFMVEVIWDKAFKSGLSKFCGRQPLKNSKGCGML